MLKPNNLPPWKYNAGFAPPILALSAESHIDPLLSNLHRIKVSAKDIPSNSNPYFPMGVLLIFKLNLNDLLKSNNRSERKEINSIIWKALAKSLFHNWKLITSLFAKCAPQYSDIWPFQWREKWGRNGAFPGNRNSNSFKLAKGEFYFQESS